MGNLYFKEKYVGYTNASFQNYFAVIFFSFAQKNQFGKEDLPFIICFNRMPSWNRLVAFNIGVEI